MYYFYIIVSAFGRIGFGIAQDPKERNKQYCSHSGGVVNFVRLYGGRRAMAKALERTIKTQYVDNLWKIEEWETEWLNESITVEEFQSYVDQMINERHFKLKLVKRDFNFQQDL